MARVMVTLKLDPEHSSAADVRAAHDISAAEMDEDFGVIEVSPEQSLYAILIDPEAAQRIQGGSDVQGPFSNPKIEPFGPPTPSE